MVARKVSELGELSESERQVLTELDTGEVVVLGGGGVPNSGDATRRVGAILIRILLLGTDRNDYPLHEKGLRLMGAWICDTLDLEASSVGADLALINCRFANPAGARWYLWLHIVLGWALSLLAVAGFSGTRKVGLRPDAARSGHVSNEQTRVRRSAVFRRVP